MSSKLFSLLVAIAALAWGQAQQPQQQRDLRLEKDTAAAAATSTVTIPRSYALVVGISQYKNLPQRSLQYADRDAEAIYSILISPEGGNFRAENVHKLIGPEATLAALRREIEGWLPSVAKPDDRVLLYFAGHGFVFNGKAYLAPYDLVPDDIAATGYPMDTLGNVVGTRIQARYKVLLTDACHSGAIAPDNQALNRSLLDLHTSLYSLTASRDRESSFESADWGGGHGIFTYYVVKGLEGEADQNGDGIVTADELAEYVHRNVREATNARQNPTSERGSFDPNMPLAYIPKILARRAPKAATSEYGTLVLEANLDGVEVFVDGKSSGVVGKGKPLKLEGLRPGPHTIQGVKMGYEPDGPREEMVYPGQETTVTIKILYVRRRNKQAEVELDKGLEFYNKGFAENYHKAAGHFEKALAIDPKFSQAALYLARTYNALFEDEQAEKAFRRALEIDPDYLEARASFGGALLDTGNFDEAIRQLNAVVQRDPDHALAWRLLAEAFRMKDLYPQSIDAARKAIRLNARIAEAHFFLADSLRLSGSYPEAEKEYQQYLDLSDFQSKLGGQLNYYVLGFLTGMGKKKRAAQQDIWRDLRSLAYFGLGDCERLLSRPDAAIAYYEKSLAYDKDDPKLQWALGLAFTRKAELTGSLDPL
ncbi:MAG TPA: tetratricopeptide repeat protein, partial [Bryobacterales bacterium]|nr:tetratricopeptide repeat protein [Bryobacterales bacterium]